MKKKINFILNPLILYTIAFIFSLILLKLRWSELFPKKNDILIIFLFYTFFGSIICSIVINTNFSKKKIVISKYGLYFILFGYLLDFLYGGSIPLLSFLGGNFKFSHFGGIPTFHVILVTFNVYYSIRLFQKYLHTGYKNCLYRFLITFVPSVLMFNRGMMISIILPCLLLFIYYKKSFIKVFLFIILFLYLFGLLGNLRIRSDDKDLFSEMAQPTKSFKKSNIPTVYLWAYMYIASPLANLSNAMNKEYNQNNVKAFFFENFIFDFISKRIFESEITYNKYLITPIFNVSSMFFKPFITMGFLGLHLFWVFNIIIILFVNRLFGTNSDFSLTIGAMLTSIMILNFFSNMWVFSPISFPLVWCIFFSCIRGLKKWFI